MKHRDLYSTPKNLLMQKKSSIMTRKNPFGTKVSISYYSFIYFIILQHFVVEIKLLFIKLNITF